MAKRSPRAGSLHQRAADGLWVFMVDLGSEGGKRHRRAFYGQTPQEAEGKGRAAFPYLLHPDQEREVGGRHKVLAAARAKGKHSRRDWFAKVERLGHLCHYCQRDTRDPAVGLVKEHTIPISRGGSDALDNVVPACRACNYAKGNMTLDEWAAMEAARG